LEIIYIIMPFIGWVVAGVVKFAVNYIRHGKEALELIGNGGFPSTHTTVVTSTVMLIGFSEGFLTPIFGLALTFLYITIIDATGIRRTVGRHASVINKYVNTKEEKPLRERQGHNHLEIAGGLFLGSVLAFFMSRFL
jgi:uncharacterized protein